MKNLNYIRYPGNKNSFLNIILPLITSHKDVTRVVEPFGGSGAVSLAVSQTHVPEVVLNDSDGPRSFELEVL